MEAAADEVRIVRVAFPLAISFMELLLLVALKLQK